MVTFVAREADFLVINKEAGVSTHHSPGDDNPNLVDLIKDEYPLVHPVIRLDAQTSGLVLFGLNSAFVHNVKFEEKKYLALVFGQTPEEGIIDRELTKRHFKTKEKITQKALTKYKKIDGNEEFSLLEIEIETGRHHQIRKHLQSIDHPIIGDFRHGYKKQNLELQEKLGKRLSLCLQCSGLKFVYNKKEYTYQLDTCSFSSLNSMILPGAF